MTARRYRPNPIETRQSDSIGPATPRRVGAIADRSLRQLQTFPRISSMIHTSHYPKDDIVSVRLKVATIAAVMFGCTPQECEKNGASLF
jgi:hypothetical protein